MAHANIQLQNHTIQIQTVPGSGLIKVLLPDVQDCFYNPQTGLLSTSPADSDSTPDLIWNHLPELKAKLNEFDAYRRKEIARSNARTSGL